MLWDGICNSRAKATGRNLRLGWLNTEVREEGAVKKRTRGWLTGAAVLAAAAVAGLQLIRRRRRTADEQGRFDRESEIDDRIAESFPASDPPWQP